MKHIRRTDKYEIPTGMRHEQRTPTNDSHDDMT